MIAIAVCKRLLCLSNERALYGAVHSVFDRAVNFEMENRAGLIGLIARGNALTPYAVSVRTERPFSQAGVRAGMAAAIRDGGLSVPEAELEVDLIAAEPVDLSVDSIALPYRSGAAEALFERILSALADADAEASLAPIVMGGRGNAYTKFILPRLEQLSAAVSVEAEEAAALAASRVAGCGMGLTPSSDDFLAGYFTTLHILLRARGRDQLRGMIPRMAQAAAKKTNRISATFLLHSGEGLCNAALCDLYRAVFQYQDEAAAQRAIERVLAIGSTSGADMLAGVAFALRQNNGGNEQW
jgi:hypothetical protein